MTAMSKKSQEAKVSAKAHVKKAAEAAVKSSFLEMNVKFVGNESVIQTGETRDVKLTLLDEDNFLAVEKSHKPSAPRPDRKRKVLARTIHGTMSQDNYGVYVGFYFRNDEITKNVWLAESLESEAEKFGDEVVEMEELCQS